MRVCKYSCDITRILIGYVLSDAHFDWLAGNMSAYQEVVNKQHFPSFVELFSRNVFRVQVT